MPFHCAHNIRPGCAVQHSHCLRRSLAYLPWRTPPPTRYTVSAESLFQNETLSMRSSRRPSVATFALRHGLDGNAGGHLLVLRRK